MAEKKRTTIYIGPDKLDELKIKAIKEKTSVTVLVDKAITKLLKEK